MPDVGVEYPDPLHGATRPQTYWSTSNAGEAMPGVLTPLGWTLWGVSLERTVRRSFAALGAIPRQETAVPDDPRDRCAQVFFGRAAASIDFIAYAADRLPGTSGAALAVQLLGFMPDGLVSRPTRRRYPVVAVRLPITFVTIPWRLHRARRDTERWWRRAIHRLDDMDLATVRAQFGQAWRRFERNCTLQGTVLFGAIQPLYEQLQTLARSAGSDATEQLMSGYGNHAETAVVTDLWALSRAHLTRAEFLRRHGYHGPHEGEVSSRVWREDDTHIQVLLRRYGELTDDFDPVHTARAQIDSRRAAQQQLLTALPAWRRPGARLLMALARRYIPLRGVAKVAFLQSIDVARGCARRIGDLLVADDLLDDRDDVFFLTAEELTGELPTELREVVARRRRLFDHYRTLDLPGWWQGEPVPIPLDPNPEPVETTELAGLGVSPGVVQGRATVLLDLSTMDDQDTEILVAATTDPSWASLMYVSSALVTDIGGAMSHTAIVARELGVPCVVNTKIGTRTIRTGDLLRVDGTTGTVTILASQQPPHGPQPGSSSQDG